jgi:gliding motility-associated-like protein
MNIIHKAPVSRGLNFWLQIEIFQIETLFCIIFCIFTVPTYNLNAGTAMRLLIQTLLICLLTCWLPLFANGQCSGIDFTSDLTTTKKCPPNAIKFTAKGVPSGSSYSWDFGTGAVSGTDTIYKIFVTPAKYTVTLKITLSNGTVCKVTKKDMFEILPAPTPVIGVTPGRFLCNGSRKITFIDSTPNSVKRDWVIDGTTYIDSPASITQKFTSTGTKGITLRVTNSYGCIGIYTNNSFVTVSDPASLCFSATVVQGKTNFKATYTPNVSLSGRTIKSYKWDFPGGTPSSDTTATPPLITYAGATAKHDAGLTIKTSDGCTYTQTRKDFIEPSIGFKPDSACINTPVNLIIKATAIDKNFTWYINNGTVNNTNDTAVFTAPGSQSPWLTFFYSGFNSCTNSVRCPTCILKVLGTKATFSAKNHLLCTIKDTLTMIGDSNGFGGGTPTYKWEFFDTLGKKVTPIPIGASNKVKARFYMPKQGVFDVRLTVTTTSGCVDTTRRDAYVVIRKPIADFKADSTIKCFDTKTPVVIANLTTPPDDYNKKKLNLYTYEWDVEDIDSPGNYTPSSARTLNFTAKYPGRYNVLLAVKNATGCADTMRKMNYLQINGFKAKLVPRGITQGCPPFTSHLSLLILKKYPDTSTNIPKITWKGPASGATFFNSSDTGTDVRIDTSGSFLFSANLRDSAHCDKLVSYTYTSGVGDSFSVAINSCLGTATAITNYSSLSPDKYKWSVTPAAYAGFTPSDTAMAPGIIYTKDTSYNITLQTFKTYSNGTGTCSASYSVFIPQLAVGKLDFSVLQDSAFCAPTLAKFLNTSRDVKSFTWYFGDGDSFSNKKSDPSTVGHLYLSNNPGGYSVTLVGYDTIGCRISVTKTNILHIIGPAPGFKVSSHLGCDSLYVHFRDTSTNIRKFVMNYDDGSPQDSVKIHDHIYKLSNNSLDSQIFNPVMVALDASNCRSYFKDFIKLYRSAVPAFKASDSTGCPPLKVTFTDASVRAAKSYWDFNGDGKIDDSSASPSYTYSIPGNYNVKLYVKNKGGCIDSLIKTSYIKVIPIPSANIKLSNKNICGSGSISYTNTSSAYSAFSYNYGDGTARDSNTLKPHSYTFTAGIDSQLVFPKLTLYNSLGCSISKIDTIILYRKPNAGFYANVYSGCESLTVRFSDTTRNSYSRSWDLDNNGSIDDSVKNPIRILKAGTYSVSLNSSTRSGCSTNIVKYNLITVYPKPKASFAVSDTLVCSGTIVKFKDNSTTRGVLNTWKWKFNEVAAKIDIDTVANPSFIFLTPGKHIISLKITNNSGCSDSAIFNSIRVKDSTSPQPSSILYVSVMDNRHVRVVWQKNQHIYFNNYTLYNNGQSAYNTTDRLDTLFTDTIASGSALNTSLNNYCYSLKTASDCNKSATAKKQHCTILLSVTPAAGSSNKIQWTPYTGWDDLLGYTLFISTDGAPYKKAGVYSAGTLTATDSNLCNHTYCYYVEASRAGATYVSKSNIACSAPNYVYQATPLNLRYATVAGNSAVELSWDRSIQSNVKKYMIERYDGFSGRQDRFATTPDTFFRDNDVSVNSLSYLYRIKEEDNCGNTSPYSNIGKTILLKNSVKDDKISLGWTKYAEWKSGIRSSRIQLKEGAGDFINIADVPGTDSTYISTVILPESDTAYCFRIISYSNSTKDSSVSNLSCAILPSRAYLPNAFSPNADGLNDVWKPSTSFINNYTGAPGEFSLRIYDRWGEKMYETHDLRAGWDGYFNGKLMPAGMYVFMLNAEGLDGRSYYFKGNITLIK